MNGPLEADLWAWVLERVGSWAWAALGIVFLVLLLSLIFGCVMGAMIRTDDDEDGGDEWLGI